MIRQKKRFAPLPSPESEQSGQEEPGEQIDTSQEQLEAIQEQLYKQEIVNQLHILSRDNCYADAIDKQDEIGAYISEHGGDVETAYNVLLTEAVLERTEEPVVEDIVAYEEAPAPVSNTPQLTETQLEVATSYGMTADEYAKYAYKDEFQIGATPIETLFGVVGDVNNKPADASQLTKTQLEIAKAYGMTASEYAKYATK